MLSPLLGWICYAAVVSFSTASLDPYSLKSVYSSELLCIRDNFEMGEIEYKTNGEYTFNQEKYYCTLGCIRGQSNDGDRPLVLYSDKLKYNSTRAEVSRCVHDLERGLQARGINPNNLGDETVYGNCQYGKDFTQCVNKGLTLNNEMESQ